MIVLKVTNLTKVQINDRFFENCEYLFWNWPFKMILTAGTYDFQSPTNLNLVESLRKYADCLEELLKIAEVVRSE